MINNYNRKTISKAFRALCLSALLFSFSPKLEAQSGKAALSFDGIDDYINMGNVIQGFTAVTFESWVYYSGTAPGDYYRYHEICSKETINSFSIQNWDNRVHLNFGNGYSWGNPTISNSPLPLNQWVHIAGTRDVYGNTKIYINGVLDATGFNDYSGANTIDRAIGFKPPLDFGVAIFAGMLDEIRIWNKEKSNQEILNDMNGEIAASQTCLLLYYKFNEGTPNASNSGVTTVLDASGNGYTGTLVNFALSGNSSNFTTPKVIVSAPTISIADAKALSYNQIPSNTVFPDYAPAASITLTAAVSGVNGNPSYSWNTGATTQSITVSPASNTTYTVSVSSGCGKMQASKTVIVKSIGCGNGKVNMCHIHDNNLLHEQTICIGTSAVAAHLNKGCQLGACLSGARGVQALDESKEFSVRIAPNPSTDHFRIAIEGNNITEKAELRVIDFLGRVVEIKKGLEINKVVSVAANLQPGTYIVEVIQGVNRKNLTLVKTK